MRECRRLDRAHPKGYLYYITPAEPGAADLKIVSARPAREQVQDSRERERARKVEARERASERASDGGEGGGEGGGGEGGGGGEARL